MYQQKILPKFCTSREQALGVFALKQVVNNGGLFCEAEVNILMRQRSTAVIIKLPCAVVECDTWGTVGESV